MDLRKILEGVENKDELIKKIEESIGTEFVPRTEFNAKNEELKKLEKQAGDLNSTVETLNAEKTKFDETIAGLNGKISSYELSSMKARIAHEKGIPYELAGRLSGEDEKSILEDAESLSKLIKNKPAPPPLKSTEPTGADGKDAAYKALLTNIKGE